MQNITHNKSSCPSSTTYKKQYWGDVVAVATMAKRIVDTPDFKQLEYEILHDCDPISMTSILGRMHDQYGNHPILSYYYGLVWSLLGDIKSAIENFKDALCLSKLDPNGICKRDFTRELGSAVFWLANYRRANGQLEAAKRTLSMMPDTYDCLKFKNVVMADVFIAEGHYDCAIDALLNVGHDVETLSNIGLCQSRLGMHNYAADSYQQALKIDPGNAQLHYLMGCELIKCGKIDEAVVAFKHAYKLEPDIACVQNNLAYVLAIKSKGKKAVIYASNAVRLEPSSARNHGTMAFAFLADGNNTEALKAALKAISLDWTLTEAWYHAGVANWRLGNKTKAHEIYTKLLTLDLAWAGLLAIEYQTQGNTMQA